MFQLFQQIPPRSYGEIYVGGGNRKDPERTERGTNQVLFLLVWPSVELTVAD